jgi:hypothetical protein
MRWPSGQSAGTGGRTIDPYQSVSLLALGQYRGLGKSSRFSSIRVNEEDSAHHDDEQGNWFSQALRRE